MTCLYATLAGIALVIPAYVIWQMRVTTRHMHFTNRREINALVDTFKASPHRWKVWEHEA